jgi:hypothetical protein
MEIQYYLPGQKATLFLETVDGYGSRTDSLTNPVVERVVFPDLSLALNFPQSMIKLDVGLYYFQFTLPVNAAAVGSYLADVSFTNPINGYVNIQGYQLIVNAAFGNFGTSVTF